MNVSWANGLLEEATVTADFDGRSRVRYRGQTLDIDFTAGTSVTIETAEAGLLRIRRVDAGTA